MGKTEKIPTFIVLEIKEIAYKFMGISNLESFKSINNHLFYSFG